MTTREEPASRVEPGETRIYLKYICGALGAALLHCSNGFRRPLLTGNGISAGFSVLVRLAYELRSRASARFVKIMREETCIN